jgi:flagellar biosynthesis/type III secretory pathway chaperone
MSATAGIEAILTDLLSRHRELLQCATDMQNAIKRKDLAGVQQATARYDELVGAVESLEEQRLAVCDAFAREHELGDRHITVREILAHVPAPVRDGLCTLRRSLKEAIDRLTHLNTANRILMEESLRAFGKAVELRATAGARLGGYGRTGAHDSRPRVRSLVNEKA